MRKRLIGQCDAKALELSRSLVPARFTEVAKVFEPVSVTVKKSRRLRFDEDINAAESMGIRC